MPSALNKRQVLHTRLAPLPVKPALTQQRLVLPGGVVGGLNQGSPLPKRCDWHVEIMSHDVMGLWLGYLTQGSRLMQSVSYWRYLYASSVYSNVSEGSGYSEANLRCY